MAVKTITPRLNAQTLNAISKVLFIVFVLIGYTANIRTPVQIKKFYLNFLDSEGVGSLPSLMSWFHSILSWDLPSMYDAMAKREVKMMVRSKVMVSVLIGYLAKVSILVGIKKYYLGLFSILFGLIILLLAHLLQLESHVHATLKDFDLIF